MILSSKTRHDTPLPSQIYDKKKRVKQLRLHRSTLPRDTLYIDDVETLPMIEEEAIYLSNIKILSIFYLCLSYNGSYYE